MAVDPDARLDQPESGDTTRSHGLIFAIVATAILMSSIDSTIVATALPAIHKSLHATINWAGWTITIYSLGMVIVLPISGKISDQFGRRRIFLYGVTLFTASSLLCGLSSDVYMLIAFRALQAVGGAALQPSAAGIVADHFGKDRDRAIGMFGTIAATGQVVGPLVGGILVGYLSWRWIFFVNLPIGVLLLIGILRFIPESTNLTKSKTDIQGLILLACFILLLNFGITSIGNRNTGFDDPIFFVPILGSFVFFYLSVRHARHTSDPLIPMRLLRAKGFAVMNAENLMWGGCGFGMATLAPLYAQERYHLAVLNAGSLLAARGVGAVVCGAVAAVLLRRTGYRMPLMVGFTVAGLGTIMMAIAPHFGISPYTWLTISAGITGLGTGFANPASRNACLQVAPQEVAAITGLRQMFVYIGIILSVSVVTAIVNRSGDPGITQSHILWVVSGILIVVMVPLARRVPDHKGSW